MQTTAAIALLAMFSGSVQPGASPSAGGQIELIQATTPSDDAHTLFQPNAPDPGRSGQIEQLPQGGLGVTTGGTPHYQTLGTPAGNAISVPNGNNTSRVIGSTGRSGTTVTPP